MQPTRIPMALSLARSSTHPTAALAAPRVSQSAPALPFHSARRPYPRLRLRFPAAAVAASSPLEAAEAEREKRRKLYVSNLPWSLPAPEVEKLFAQCGTVKGVEVIKGKDGRNRGVCVHHHVDRRGGSRRRGEAQRLGCQGTDHQGGIFKEFQKTCSTCSSSCSEAQALGLSSMIKNLLGTVLFPLAQKRKRKLLSLSLMGRNFWKGLFA